MPTTHHEVELVLALIALAVIAVSAASQLSPPHRRGGILSDRARGFATAGFIFFAGLRMSWVDGVPALRGRIEGWDLVFAVFGGVCMGMALCIVIQLTRPALLTAPWEKAK